MMMMILTRKKQMRRTCILLAYVWYGDKSHKSIIDLACNEIPPSTDVIDSIVVLFISFLHIFLVFHFHAKSVFFPSIPSTFPGQKASFRSILCSFMRDEGTEGKLITTEKRSFSGKTSSSQSELQRFGTNRGNEMESCVKIIQPWRDE